MKRMITLLYGISLLILGADSTDVNGEYEMILNNKPGYYFNSDIKTSGNENVDNPDANTYSIIGDIKTKQDDYKINDKFQFKLVYKYSDETTDTLEWKQASFITEPDIIDADLFGIPTQLYTGANTARFRGLGLNYGGYSGYSYLDGDGGGHSHFWNSVGEIIAFYAGIPAFNAKIASTSTLYILKPRTVVNDDPDPRTCLTTPANMVSWYDGNSIDIANNVR
eukprot:379598_1